MHVNGYQTVCAGCFAPYPYGAPPDPRFGDVIQFMSNATSRYNGLQLTPHRRLTAGLSWIVNYTLSHSQDDVSNGGFLPFRGRRLAVAAAGRTARSYGNADYDIRHNLTASYTYELPFHASRPWLDALVERLAGLPERVSGTPGVPFTVLSAPYTANGNGIINGGGPEFASLVPGVPIYRRRRFPA